MTTNTFGNVLLLLVNLADTAPITYGTEVVARGLRGDGLVGVVVGSLAAVMMFLLFCMWFTGCGRK